MATEIELKFLVKNEQNIEIKEHISKMARTHANNSIESRRPFLSYCVQLFDVERTFATISNSVLDSHPRFTLFPTCSTRPLPRPKPSKTIR